MKLYVVVVGHDQPIRSSKVEDFKEEWADDSNIWPNTVTIIDSSGLQQFGGKLAYVGCKIYFILIHFYYITLFTIIYNIKIFS